jgi:hypothetical protein
MATPSDTLRKIPAERRRGRRHPAAKVPHIHASILAGPDVKIVDVSPHGLLIETDVRLIPGAGICLTIAVGNESHMLGGRVARVDAAVSGKSVMYRAGIALDGLFAPFDLSSQESEPTGATEPAPPAPGPAGEKPVRAATPEAPPAAPVAIEALREALTRQHQAQQHETEVVDTLKAALRASERSRRESEQVYLRERETWAQERRSFEQALEIAARHKEKLSGELAASDDRVKTIANELETIRAAAAAEQALFEEQLRGESHKTEASLRELIELRESQRLLTRTLDEERAMLADLLQEKDRLIADLESAGADLERTSLERDRANERWQAGEVERVRLARQLEVSERWCADQHELIYQLWQQALRSTSLIEGWKSIRHTSADAAPDPVVSTPASTDLPAGADDLPACDPAVEISARVAE